MQRLHLISAPSLPSLPAYLPKNQQKQKPSSSKIAYTPTNQHQKSPIHSSISHPIPPNDPPNNSHKNHLLTFPRTCIHVYINQHANLAASFFPIYLFASHQLAIPLYSIHPSTPPPPPKKQDPLFQIHPINAHPYNHINPPTHSFIHSLIQSNFPSPPISKPRQETKRKNPSCVNTYVWVVITYIRLRENEWTVHENPTSEWEIGRGLVPDPRDAI